jgi:hypothetical protein
VLWHFALRNDVRACDSNLNKLREYAGAHRQDLKGGLAPIKISGGYNGEVTPVPIPNTEVKLSSAEDTWLATARENMSPPDLYSSIAQLVEHAAVNRRVVGSSPT